MTDRDPSRSVVDLITGSWRAQAVYTAAALRIPDHVAAGHRSVDEIAAAAGASTDGVRRLMRLLAGMGVFAGTEGTGYRLTGVSDALRGDRPGSMRDLCLIYGDEFYRAWGEAAHAVTTGESGFERAFGAPLAAYLRRHPETGARFQRAMSAGSRFFADVPRAFDFSACRTVVDVAGGNGALLSAVLGANPGARGVLLDLPHMTTIAREQVGRLPGLERCEIVAGDLFESVPAGGDAYLLSRVLQDWDDDRCARALGNCRDAMAPGTALLILERVIPPEDRAARGDGALSLLWDLHLLMAAGGRERTLPQYRALLDGAGLRLESAAGLPLEMTLLVARPA
ncbi:MAG: methyltransferase [Chloroflexi bacterium]|nr:MAG: methyltransferase [Chloroflexota bacterium]